MAVGVAGMIVAVVMVVTFAMFMAVQMRRSGPVIGTIQPGKICPGVIAPMGVVMISIGVVILHGRGGFTGRRGV